VVVNRCCKRSASSGDGFKGMDQTGVRKVSPELEEALKALKKIGYAVGRPTISKAGSLQVSVGARMLQEEQVLERMRAD
jgi:hypothetical protein